MIRIHAFVIPFLALACSADTGADTEAIGAATYRDAETDGSAQKAAPVRDEFTVRIVTEGTATTPEIDPSCLDQASGQFVGLFEGTAEVDDGIYAAAFASGSAELATPSGCEIPDVEISTLIRVAVRGEIAANAKTCETYCAAKARSEAEAACEAAANQAECRGEAEASYQASCEMSCTTVGHVIVAETELSAGARAELAAQALSGGALGTFSADLVFERVEDDGGATVNEAQ